MSEYQRLKARALEIQQEKEQQLKRELAAKAERDKQAAKGEEERKKRLEAAAKDARRRELMAANAALHSAPSAAKASDYDPFAEDAMGTVALPKTTSRKAPTTNGSRAPAASSSKPKAASAPRPRKSEQKDVALGRKERAALQLAKQSKASAVDSMFSVHSLVAAHEGSASPRASPPRRAPPNPLPKSALGRPGAKAPVKGGMAGMKKSLDVSGLRKLCPDRSTRDTRTIDEIQRDIRMRKETASGRAAAPVSKGSSNGDRERPRSLGDDRRPRAPARDPKARRRSPSYDSESDSDSPPRRKRPRSPGVDGEPSRQAVSALIQSMFSRGRAPRAYADDDSGSDMEAGLEDVEAEERRALKIARKEDEAAEREEAARKAAKEKQRRERERKGR